VLTAKVQIGDKVFEMPMRPDNPFFTGDVTPLIPREARKIDDGNVEMIYESPDGLRAVAHWTLEKGRWDAGFGLTLTPEKSGHYSVVYSPFKEWAREEIDFVQLPPVYQFQRIPEYARLVTSSLTPHAMSLIQVAPDEMDNQDVCLAVSAEPKALPFRWPKARNPICGFTLLNQAANVQPTIFMPILGLEGSEWQADQPQRVTWRVLTYPGRWNEALEYYSDTVMGVKDYRSPIYGSLTDAALNMMDLMLDPVASGWDDELKGFYNIEGVGSVTQASPLAMVSAAMLRRDDEIFAKRALPSIEFTLTRVGAHFGLPDARWTTDTLHVPSTFYGTSYWQGLHMLLKGLNPWIADMAFENGDIRHSQDYNESSQWSELLAAWKLRPSDELMQKIIAGADAFIEESFNTRHTEPLDPIKFYNISFYPYWWDLIDLYEMTGDRKYLDAAEEGAFHTVAGQWSQPVVPDGDIEVHPDDQVKGETGILWKNRDRQRLGFPRQPGDTPSKIIPAWQVAQVGLGLEQPTTYFWVTREDAMRHILMSIWAPHLLRVYQHTGREIFRTYARNSAVGRFTNYPGYYMTVFSDLYMRPEYPSEGPDISGIYYHHIPVQLGWTLDYLLEQVFLRSNNHIQFPWVWQKNYAYFVSRVYGAEPGTIYNQKDAELWLDRRLVKIDNPNIDWLAARSPDRFFLILMSQDDEDVDLPLELNADFIGLKKGQGYAYREEGKITAEVLPETPTEINVPARGIVTLSLPAKEGVVFPDLPKVETGHIQVDINPEWGALHVFRVRSPMGKDAIYAALIKGPHDGAKVNVTVKGADQQPPVRERFPYEFSVYPWPLGKPAELEVTIEGPGDFRKSLLVTMP
ncbi:hypothetical protein HQ520_10610, partial [bacterium]|nr:hypothetical protein [bacterium]